MRKETTKLKGVKIMNIQKEDIFEEAFNQILAFGGKFMKNLIITVFSLLREIKGFGETVYTLSDFKEV